MGLDGARQSLTSRSKEPLDEVLLEERLVGYLDPGGEDVIRKLNFDGVETTSSCLGRITVIEGDWPWERREETRIVFKSHLPVSPTAIALVASRPFDSLWLKVNGPIFHLRVRDHGCAESLLSIAREAGFKHSGAISLKPREGCCVVEISAPTEFAAPLKLYGRIMVSGNALKLLVSKANSALAEGRARLERLLSLLERARQHCSDQAS